MESISNQQLINNMQQLIESAKGQQSTQQVPMGEDFQSALSNALNKVNDLSMQAGDMTTKFEQGDPNVALSDVMIAMQKSTVAFEATLQVRNRIVAAYQEIMNMPI